MKERYQEAESALLPSLGGGPEGMLFHIIPAMDLTKLSDLS